MKKCPKCGAIQNNNRMICIDCDTPLGASLSKEENDELEMEIQSYIDTKTEQSDDFYVSPFDIAMIALNIFLAVAVLVLFILFPENQLGLGLMISYFTLTLIFMLMTAFPKGVWEIHIFFMSFSYDNTDYLSPGPTWRSERKVVVFIPVVIGIMCILAICSPMIEL